MSQPMLARYQILAGYQLKHAHMYRAPWPLSFGWWKISIHPITSLLSHTHAMFILGWALSFAKIVRCIGGTGISRHTPMQGIRVFKFMLEFCKVLVGFSFCWCERCWFVVLCNRDGNDYATNRSTKFALKVFY